jgi:hypothetical protein
MSEYTHFSTCECRECDPLKLAKPHPIVETEAEHAARQSSIQEAIEYGQIRTPERSQMTGFDQLVELGFSEGEATVLQTALLSLALIPEERFREVARTIERCMDFGPFIDPTLFVQPGNNAFNTGRKNKELFLALANLRQLLSAGAP